MQGTWAREPWKPVDTALAVLLGVVALAIRAHWALSGDGFFHPDEIYQAVEPAHRLVYGFGLHAWEWDIGARNWTLPGVLAAVLAIARQVGWDSPATYVPAVRVFTACLYSLGAAGAYLLARQHRASRWAAFGAVALFVCNPAAIYLGYRPFSEILSTPFVVFGLAFSLRADVDRARGRRAMILGMSLLGIAVLLRLQNALFAGIVVGTWRLTGQKQRYQLAMRVLVAWALVYGLVDWVTWGLPFKSAGAYLRFNLLLDGATSYYGADSLVFYPRVFWQSMGPGGALLLVLPWLAWRRARLLLGCAMGFFVAHWFFPHKELRFVMGGLPLLAALSAVGVQALVDRVDDARSGRAAAIGALAAAALIGVAAVGVRRVDGLTFGQLGEAHTLHVDPSTSAFDHPGNLDRLLVAAASRPDICGLFLADRWAVKAGGYTYFHRDVPFYHQGNPPAAATMYNYAIADHKMHSGWAAVARRGAHTLFATGRTSCTRDPSYKPVIYQFDDAPK